VAWVRASEADDTVVILGARLRMRTERRGSMPFSTRPRAPRARPGRHPSLRLGSASLIGSATGAQGHPSARAGGEHWGEQLRAEGRPHTRSSRASACNTRGSRTRTQGRRQGPCQSDPGRQRTRPAPGRRAEGRPTPVRRGLGRGRERRGAHPPAAMLALGLESTPRAAHHKRRHPIYPQHHAR
jgi:hypothetical protein